MPIDPNAPITITAYDWVPEFARGQVRDLRVRWALEEVGQDYAVRTLAQGHQKQPAHRALQPFGQVPTYEEKDLTLFESGAIVWHIAERFPGLLAPYPNLVAYVARGTERPAFRQALGDQMADFTGNPPPGFDEWMADLQASKGETS